jgi:hypothetical protein
MQCPYRLSSTNGSSMCSFCDKNFYLNDVSAPGTSIFQNPSEYCLPCPPNALCDTGTTLVNLGVPKNYWRYSRSTSKIYHCKRSSSCIGTAPVYTWKKKRHSHSRSVIEDSSLLYDQNSIYCNEGHTGPLCEVCTKMDHFFSTTNRQCTKCPSSVLIAFEFLGIFFGAIVVIAVVFYFLRKYIPSFFSIMLSISPQAKVKLLVSFYQVLSSLENVYGVTI